MLWSDIEKIFSRALIRAFDKKKLIITFCVLVLCGVLAVFFRGLAISSSHWVAMSMTFLPIFLCGGILLALGVMLIRVYHDQIKKREVSYNSILSKSWDIMIGASYFSLPIILCYLILWMLLGVFILLQEIPGVGDFFSVVLAFAPFLLNLGSLILCVLMAAMLFFLTPILALHGMNRMLVTQVLMKRWQEHIFTNLALAFLALFPLLFLLGLLSLAGFLTGSICYTCVRPIHNVLQWFFIMIPFTAILSPAVVFFFNFAAESHVLLKKIMNEQAHN